MLTELLRNPIVHAFTCRAYYWYVCKWVCSKKWQHNIHGIVLIKVHILVYVWAKTMSTMAQSSLCLRFWEISVYIWFILLKKKDDIYNHCLLKFSTIYKQSCVFNFYIHTCIMWRFLKEQKISVNKYSIPWL